MHMNYLSEMSTTKPDDSASADFDLPIWLSKQNGVYVYTVPTQYKQMTLLH